MIKHMFFMYLCLVALIQPSLGLVSSIVFVLRSKTRDEVGILHLFLVTRCVSKLSLGLSSTIGFFFFYVKTRDESWKLAFISNDELFKVPLDLYSMVLLFKQRDEESMK